MRRSISALLAPSKTDLEILLVRWERLFQRCCTTYPMRPCRLSPSACKMHQRFGGHTSPICADVDAATGGTTDKGPYEPGHPTHVYTRETRLQWHAPGTSGGRPGRRALKIVTTSGILVKARDPMPHMRHRIPRLG